MRLAGFLALSSCLLASGSEAADGRLLEQAAPCLAAADRGLCFLKVSVGEDGGSAIWRDPELRARPEILASLGVTERGVAAARGLDEGERMFFGGMDEAEAAAREALALDRAGRPPHEALKPILELSLAPTPVPPFFMPGGQLPPARTGAYQELFEAPDGSVTVKASPALARAAADAWERDITAADAAPIVRASAGWLARARQALGDDAGVTRALALIASPVDRLEILAQIGRVEEAAAGALALDRAQLAAMVRARLTAKAAFIARAEAEHLARNPDPLAEVARQARADNNTALLKALENARAAPPKPQPVTRAEVDAAVADELAGLEDAIIRAAARHGRPHAAAPLAERILAQDDLVENRYRFPSLIRAVPPDAAAARLEALEAGLTARRGAQRLEPIVNAWTSIGRPERADQLLDRVRAWARPGQPGYAAPLARLLHARGRFAEAAALSAMRADEKLEADIAAGRGLAGFDAYLAEGTAMNGTIGLVVSCASAAERARAWPLAVQCAERHGALLTNPQQRYALSGRALELAARAADEGDSASARRLTDIGFQSGLAAQAADPTIRDWPPPLNGATLISIAKAELRAAGRLPPKAATR